MKRKNLLFVIITLMLTTFTCIAQDATKAHPAVKDIIPFGKKLPPPNLTIYPGKPIQSIHARSTNTALMPRINDFKASDIKKDPNGFKQQILKRNYRLPLVRNSGPRVAGLVKENDQSSDFHLTKDINALAESYPSNYSDLYFDQSYAILKNVIYFAADDGIHGSELWRSDGTAAGTYMIKDIEPGLTSSSLYNITALNGKLYFSAITSVNGLEPWVSDGTEGGTQLLKDIQPGPNWSEATQFVRVGNTVYFIADGDFSFWGTLWKTDGTTESTTLVKNIGDEGNGGGNITQVTAVNDLLFFTFFSFESFSWELWRSNGTAKGTYHIGTNVLFPYVPAQLTSYDKRLFFSADDGNGRKLWLSDGTDAGTKPVPHTNSVFVDAADYFGIRFPILDNVLYIPGYTLSKANGLYKYNALNSEGLIKVKDLTAATGPAFIVPSEMEVVNQTLYFKVTNYNDGIHDELWSSDGLKASTQIVTRFLPGETISELYNGNGMLYFSKYGKIFGAELWQVFDTFLGKFPIIQSDVFLGATSSYPGFLTAFKGKLVFSATSDKGNELFITNDLGFGAKLVKDINTVATSNSNAGFPSTFITSVGNEVFFDAYENVDGDELYKSDGTKAGTYLVKDILPGETGSSPQLFLSKNDAAYFLAFSNDTSFSIYKTDGTKNGLKKMTPDYVYYYYGLVDYVIAGNGLVFYVLFNYNTSLYELWCTNGTNAGTSMLSSAVYYPDYLNVVGSTAFFVAGDNIHGYELWKSDGKVANTMIVKDINPGIGDAAPGGMFVYNKEVYFGAYDGTDHAFWKSDGTKAGTVELKNIDPWWDGNVISTAQYYFEVSNNILYFSAINYSNKKGTQLWKTDGTANGTEAVKDVSPDANSFTPVPFYFTDVSGTVFFIGDDGINGAELWKTDGTKQETRLVKDITTGPAPSNLSNLVNYAGKLYFTNDGVLWSSDGTKSGTKPVNDPLINEVQIYNITPAGNKLFISGYTHKYGTELYAGKINDETGKFAVTAISEDAIKTSLPFNVTLYPNPAVSNSVLQLTGNIKNVSVSITDISGKKIWQINSSNSNQVNLPTQKLAAGNYMVTVTNGVESKTIKLVKQ